MMACSIIYPSRNTDTEIEIEVEEVDGMLPTFYAREACLWKMSGFRTGFGRVGFNLHREYCAPLHRGRPGSVIV